LTDAFTRRLLVVYVTFDPPSYRSAMMVLRECVWRNARLPQAIVVDGGPDFRSIYFETLSFDATLGRVLLFEEVEGHVEAH